MSVGPAAAITAWQCSAARAAAGCGESSAADPRTTDTTECWPAFLSLGLACAVKERRVAKACWVSGRDQPEAACTRSNTERQPRRPRSRETLAEAAWRARTARSTEETWLYLETRSGCATRLITMPSSLTTAASIASSSVTSSVVMRAAKYSVSVSFPPSCLITSVTAASTASMSLCPAFVALNLANTLSKATLVHPDQSEAKVSKVLAVLAAASSSPSMAAPCTASCRSRAAAVSLLSPSALPWLKNLDLAWVLCLFFTGLLLLLWPLAHLAPFPPPNRTLFFPIQTPVRLWNLYFSDLKDQQV